MKHLRSHSFVINRKDGPAAILISTHNFIKLNKLLRAVFGLAISFILVHIIMKKVKRSSCSE